jgi:hypothetical protein
VVIEGVAGRSLSDRFWWSQWLLWVSFTPAVMLAALLLIASPRPGMAERRARRMRLLWTCALAALMVHFTMFEHRFVRLPRPAAPEGQASITITHWNGTPLLREDGEAYVEAIMNAGGDVVMLTDAGHLLAHPTIRAWIGEHTHAAAAMPFIVFSRRPILRQSVIASVDEIEVMLLEIDAFEGEEPLVIYAVDLPSDPRIPRMELALRARRLIEESGEPPPDVVVGDLNITRGSAALRAMFPGMRHAFDEAGRGYGASFPAHSPLYHIDHIMVGERVRASGYELINPGVGRHLIQQAVIGTRRPAAKPRRRSMRWSASARVAG